ncbi:GNAT family N-acetyltransferase [Euzebyella marina]|uniref:GNAT family N-acetyltransferase n=1 Tax=Euzebyella marina TaxID=1761453 RepID=A0A3G2L1C3_9FLAO|nr:GNAT family N-acetyltransferase [Euzebyella marina]AYN66052.1 GNAT family N-acetyltransferase [Euzebyella marina]
MILIEVKPFLDLGLEELHEILRLRSEIFVVEQDCVYQDIDGKDERALHVIGRKNGEIVAYTRLFRAGDYFDEASFGRVAVKKSERKYGYGRQIVGASIDAIRDHFYETKIKVSAQLYLERFYHSFGFNQVGEGYLEDGIPHISMVLNK